MNLNDKQRTTQRVEPVAGVASFQGEGTKVGSLLHKMETDVGDKRYYQLQSIYQ